MRVYVPTPNSEEPRIITSIYEIKNNSHVIQLMVMATACGIIHLFIFRPDGDDVEFLQRAIYQSDHLFEPISRFDQTINAQNVPEISYAHLLTSIEFFASISGKLFGLERVYIYQVAVGAICSSLIPCTYFLLYRALGLSPMALR